jgi:chitin disaccharide deacetylase
LATSPVPLASASPRDDPAVPRLIVNGDDLGRTESNTRGIVEGYRRGIVTSTSIVANGPAFDLAVRLAAENPGLAVGVHLALQEYPPVLDPHEIPTLVGTDGRFHSMAATFRRALAGRIRLDDVRREWQAQVQKVVDQGLRPTHLDGHCHCHAHPAFAEAVVAVAARFRIPSARLPREALGRVSGFRARRYLEKAGLHWACGRTAASWKGRLAFPAAFHGFMEGGRMTAAALESIAARLRPGVSELMVHPGITNDDRPFDNGYDWTGDLDAVTRYDKPAFERRFGVRLVSHREAWS